MSVRPIPPDDVGAVVGLVRELAEYEQALDEVRLTEEQLHASLFGAHPALSALGVAYATGYLVQSLPIPFIATGGVDAATTFLLRSFGVPLDIGLAAVVTHRVFAFWLPVVPGTAQSLSVWLHISTVEPSSPTCCAYIGA